MNKPRLKSQDEKLINYLLTGRKINCTSPARRRLEIGYLNSRISAIKERMEALGRPIQRQPLVVKDAHNKKMLVKQYWA